MMSVSQLLPVGSRQCDSEADTGGPKAMRDLCAPDQVALSCVQGVQNREGLMAGKLEKGFHVKGDV